MEILPKAMRVAAKSAVVGLACGVVYAVGGLVYDLTTVGLNWGTALAFMAIVGMPAIFGVAGFVLGALGAAVGSTLFGRSGGAGGADPD